MKRVFAIAALIGVLVVQPAAAQAAAPPTASTADADLLCAAWTGSAAGSIKSEREQFGFVVLLTYFVGRWEAATGRNIEDGLTPAYITANISKIEAAKADCLARAGEFGLRLKLVSTNLQNSSSGK